MGSYDKLEVLLDEMKSADPVTQFRLASAIADRVGDGQMVVSRLIEYLQDESEDLRLAAGYALKKIGPSTVEPLMQAISTGTHRGWLDALGVLEELGQAAVQSAPTLATLLRRFPERAGPICMALSRMSPESIIPLTLELEKNAAVEVRGHVIGALGRIGPSARGAVPMISFAISQEGGEKLRWPAIHALARIDAIESSLEIRRLVLEGLRAYPKKPALRSVIKAQAAWSIAM